MKLVIFREKHDTRYFVVVEDSGSEQEAQKVQQVALRVFLDRLDDDWYVEDMTATQERYYDKAKDGDAKAALAFLNSRRDWEYEAFEVLTPEEV